MRTILLQINDKKKMYENNIDVNYKEKAKKKKITHKMAYQKKKK